MRTFYKSFFFFFSLFFSTSLYAAPVIPPSQILGHDLSVEQLRQAAEAGDPDAQYALGYLYYHGKEVDQNTTAALNWIKRASVQGQEQALVAMRILTANKTTSSRMPPFKMVNVVATKKDEEIVSSLAGAASSENISAKKVIGVTTLDTINKKPLTSILSAPDSYFTIQLLISSNKAEIERYIRDNYLGNNANYYLTQKHTYVLLYGAYPTRAAAQATLLNLPAAVKAQKPWIKQINQVKTSIQ